MGKYLFRGKPDIDQEWLDEMEFTLDEYMENLVSANYKDGFVYGQVVYSGKQPYIVGEVVESTDEWITLEYWIPVKPETVGQYTGLEDKNGVEIYEGDVLKVINPDDEEDNLCVVKWDNLCGGYPYEPWGGFGDFDVSTVGWAMTMEFTFEVIGNEWDDGDLLAGGDTHDR